MDTPPGYKLYSVGQITLAAFLGSPFPGFWMASRNFKALGRTKESRRSLVWGTGLTLACFIIAVVLPESFPAIAVSLPFVIATRSMAKQWFGHDLTAHFAAGGRIGSWWIRILVGVVSLVLILAVIVGLVMLSGDKGWTSLNLHTMHDSFPTFAAVDPAGPLAAVCGITLDSKENPTSSAAPTPPSGGGRWALEVKFLWNPLPKHCVFS
jgi:hypothetical protein